MLCIFEDIGVGVISNDIIKFVLTEVFNIIQNFYNNQTINNDLTTQYLKLILRLIKLTKFIMNDKILQDSFFNSIFYICMLLVMTADVETLKFCKNVMLNKNVDA